MKKMIILLTVILTAVMANAASYTWKASSLYQYNDAANKITEGTLVSIYATSIYTEDLQGNKIYTALSTVGASATGFVAETEFTIDAASAGDVYTFFIMYQDEYAGKIYEFSSLTAGESKEVTTPNTGTGSASFGNLATATKNTSNWAAVPEPTSGLLLLLGMAGLALRRKRA